MEWYHVLSIILGQAALYFPIFLWLRNEANNDRRELANAIMDLRKDMTTEFRDFHGRLCAIEEGRKK